MKESNFKSFLPNVHPGGQCTVPSMNNLCFFLCGIQILVNSSSEISGELTYKSLDPPPPGVKG